MTHEQFRAAQREMGWTNPEAATALGVSFHSIAHMRMHPDMDSARAVSKTIEILMNLYIELKAG